MQTQLMIIFGNYGSDVEGFDDERAKHSIRTRINKRPIDILRDIYATFISMPKDTRLVLKAFGDHLPMLSKCIKAMANLGAKFNIETNLDASNLLVVEAEITSDVLDIKMIQPEALRLVKTGYGDDSKFALEQPVVKP